MKNNFHGFRLKLFLPLFFIFYEKHNSLNPNHNQTQNFHSKTNSPILKKLNTFQILSQPKQTLIIIILIQLLPNSQSPPQVVNVLI